LVATLASGSTKTTLVFPTFDAATATITLAHQTARWNVGFFDNRRIKSVIPQIGWSCDGENFSPENHTYRTLPSFEKKAEAVSDITRVISC